MDEIKTTNACKSAGLVSFCILMAIGMTACGGNDTSAENQDAASTQQLKPGGRFIEVSTLDDISKIPDDSDSVSCEALTDILAVALSGKSGIAELFCENCAKVTDEGIKAISRLKLRTLVLSRLSDSVSDRSLTYVGRIETLKELHLTNSSKARLTRDGVAELVNLEKLLELDLSGNDWMDGNCLTAVSMCAPLRSLTLRSNRNLSGQAIVPLHDVHWLDLSDNAWVDDATLKTIGSLSGIDVVVLRRCPNASSSAIESLRKNIEVVLK